VLKRSRLWIGLAVSVATIALFLFTIDLGRMADALADADYIYLIPGLALYLVSVLFRTKRWQTLLAHMRVVSVRRLYPVVVIGYMANNLLPMRLGELVRSYYVGEREDISKTSALATIIVERVLDALILLVFIVALAIFVPLGGLVEGFEEQLGVAWPLLVAAVSVPFILLFGLLATLARYPEQSRTFCRRLLSLLPPRLMHTLLGLVELFIYGLSPLKSVRALLGLLLMSAPVWLFEAGLFFMVGLAFGLDDAFGSMAALAVAMVLVTAISNIGSSVPAAPGGIGLFELVAREALVLLPLATVDRAVAGAFAAVVHAVLLLSMIALGQVFLWRENISLRKLWRSGSAGGDGVDTAATMEGREASPAPPEREGEK